MSKRLQVLLPDREMADIRILAGRERLTVGEWVRRTLREARTRQSVNDPEARLKAVRRAVLFSHRRHRPDAQRDRTGLSGLIFIDSNIPMYLVGAAHPHKTEAQLLLERLVAAGRRLVTDAEVLQEILHRYTAIERRDAIAPALRAILDIVDDVFAIEKADVLRASEIAQNRASLSARDAIHIAVMERRKIRSILSFDADFDRWPGIERLYRI
jgi:predicted nucleic acid-binding protein